MRRSEYLRRRYREILRYTGLIWAVVGGFILAPLVSLIFFWEERFLAWGFLFPGITLIAIGLLLWNLAASPTEKSLTIVEGTVIVVLTWLAAVFVGAFPFILIGDLNFTQAIFESTSGWTTTGLSVVDVTTSSRLLLLYRSTIQLAGGAGFAIIVLAALTGPTGIGLSNAEGRVQQLVPHVRKSAAVVLGIYLLYVFFGSAALRLAGMDWFDALNHAFAALSTGGFSTRTASIGYWDSAAVEGVVIVLMLLGTTNFLTSYALLRGRLREFSRTTELRFLTLLLAVSIPLILFTVALELYPNHATKAVRVAVFEVVSAASTTGFSTVGYGEWPAVGWLVLIFFMLVGGGAGSTAGGIKQFRVVVLLRAAFWEARRWFLPQTAVTEPDVWQNGRRYFINDAEIRQTGAFVTLYLVAFLAGSISVAAHGYSLEDSLFEFASSLGTVGLSIGVTAPDAPISLLWIQICGMILGRLELFALIVGLIKLGRDLPVVLRRPETAIDVLLEQGHLSPSPFRVLLPISDRANAEQLGHFGCALASGRNGDISALTVKQIPHIMSLFAGRVMQQDLTLLFKHLDEPSRRYGIALHAIVRLARNVPEAITKTAKETGSDLILMGWPGNSLTEQTVYGPVIDALAANPPCDLGIIRLRSLTKLRTILVAVAGGPNERLAARTADALARGTPEESRVRLIHVASPALGHALSQEAAATAFGRLEADLTVPFETRLVRTDHVADGILKAAADCDLIIMGATREPWFSNALIGNIAEQVASQATCPVMVMKRQSNQLRAVLRTSILEPLRTGEKS